MNIKRDVSKNNETIIVKETVDNFCMHMKNFEDVKRFKVVWNNWRRNKSDSI